MRNLTALFVLSLVTLTGCGLLKKAGADAGTDGGTAVADNSAADAAPEAAAAAPVGKNAAQVARFGSEVAMNQPMVLGQTSFPRTSPNTGTVVATLHPGTAVTRIATNGPNENLIVFADPNVPTDNLMGWVTEAAFTAAVVGVHHEPLHDGGVVDAGAAPAATATTPSVTCAAGQIAVQQVGNKVVCKKTCAKDADCPHKGCKDFTGVAGNTVRACLND